MKISFKFWDKIKSWFANIELHNVSLFNRTYKQELYVVCDSLERLYQYKKLSQLDKDIEMAKDLKNLKTVIDIRMKREGANKNFDKFLTKKKLMAKKQVVV